MTPSEPGDGGEHLAPVTYLPGVEPQRGQSVPARGQAAPERAVARRKRPAPFSPGRAADAEPGGSAEPAAADPGPEPSIEIHAPGADVDGATQALLKKLRTRQLSAKEAKSFLSDRGVEADAMEDVVAAFEDRGYLDDARLAEQLIYAAISRTGQGRRAISQALSARGVGREVVDAALDELPDDDAERALDFARRKARSMGSLEGDAALRRLHGQLARRGFAGHMAMAAAKQALDEAGIGASRVRFR